MIEFECRRCAGRRRLAEDKGQPCYVCLGKGVIRISPKEVRDHYTVKTK